MEEKDYALKSAFLASILVTASIVFVSIILSCENKKYSSQQGSEHEENLDTRIARLQGAEREKYLLKQTESTSPKVRRWAYELLQGNSSESLWIKAIEDPDMIINLVGISELGRMGNKDAIAPLIKMFEHGGDRSFEAEIALAKIGRAAISDLWLNLVRRKGKESCDREFRYHCIATLEKITVEDLSRDSTDWIDWGIRKKSNFNADAVKYLEEVIRTRKTEEEILIAKGKALQLVANPVKKRWCVGEEVEILCVFRNVGTEDIYIAPIYKERNDPTFGVEVLVQISDKDGNVAEHDESTPRLDPIDGADRADLKDKDAIQIKKSEVWEYKLSEVVRWKPGMYEVSIKYSYNRKIPEILWRGELRSNTFSVEIYK